MIKRYDQFPIVQIASQQMGNPPSETNWLISIVKTTPDARTANRSGVLA